MRQQARMRSSKDTTEAVIGVEIGDRRNPSAICVAEEERRSDGQYHFLIRHLQRLPIGISYPDTAERVGEVIGKVWMRAERSPAIFVNATGRGQPIVDQIKRCAPRATLKTVYFNHGDRRTEDGDVVNLGKAYLVSRLQLLLQGGRLHLPRTPDAEGLAEELLGYEINVEPDANERYGAFRVGKRDDQVTALGLAVQDRKRIYSAVWRG